MNYSEGVWHALVGLTPQYDHMEGYNDYMRGYKKGENEKKQLNVGSSESLRCTGNVETEGGGSPEDKQGD